MNQYHAPPTVSPAPEPASPGPDSETTMEVDNSDVNSEGSQSMEDPEEPSTPDDKFYIEGPCLDGDKDEDTVKAIRYLLRAIFNLYHRSVTDWAIET